MLVSGLWSVDITSFPRFTNNSYITSSQVAYDSSAVLIDYGDSLLKRQEKFII